MRKNIRKVNSLRRMLGRMALTAMISSPVVAGNVTFTEIPAPNWGGSVAVSQNGVVAFTDDTRLMKWTRETGITVLGEAGWARVFDVQISTDGNVIAYIDPNTNDAFVYDGLTEKYVDRSVMNVHTLSPDGLVLGGRKMNEGYGVAATLTLSDDRITTYVDTEIHYRVVDDISNNGTLLVSTPGYITAGPSYTVSATGESQLVPDITFVHGMSDDGQTVIGRKYRCEEVQSMVCAVRFDVNTGLVSEIGEIIPTGISADGSIIVGRSANAESTGAKIWDSFNGVRTISDVLTSKGIDVSSWDFTRNELNISDDGNKIVGHAVNPNGDTVPFLIDIIPQCSVF